VSDSPLARPAAALLNNSSSTRALIRLPSVTPTVESALIRITGAQVLSLRERRAGQGERESGNPREGLHVGALCDLSVLRSAKAVLRSTFASRALAASVSVFQLARIIGTSVRMIERHYGALLDGSGAEIATRLDALDASEEREDEAQAEDR
jgi:hypothetical protein